MNINVRMMLIRMDVAPTQGIFPVRNKKRPIKIIKRMRNFHRALSPNT
jgi:hypothetical protein